ncbi:hypothetical protein P152DRAFT_474569 [Eremomyces bilateralis CBS 781.70]|uniref:CT20-domain-containing protein n=1 Tax=Eremomyces bilateralis CBS 781.70 TaxID=1392243 RepID=A0A6G1G1P9_9PEZI|nr:uncharacterized protein P152DRAFT_474569 [Eremomyces bilateralis CBS 781.70]KAF1811850.1 hypothetical protein P152DRAFT_474569 [Eremomyces bilateralis CBS 781.70]
MPPKKRQRVSAATSPFPISDVPLAPPSKKDPSQLSDEAAKHDVLDDLWTDDQESSLFKSMIKWKPTGVHKHFRMLAISNQLRSQGFANTHINHTRIPGIWAKLNTLYELDSLDERENNEVLRDYPDPSEFDDLESDEELVEFALPSDEFGDMIWSRRFPSESKTRSSSPFEIPGLEHVRPTADFTVTRGTDAADEDESETPRPGSSRARTVKSGKGRGSLAKPSASRQTKGGSTVDSSVGDASEDEADEDDEDDASEDETSGKGVTKTNPTKRKSVRRGARRR